MWIAVSKTIEEDGQPEGSYGDDMSSPGKESIIHSFAVQRSATGRPGKRSVMSEVTRPRTSTKSETRMGKK